MRVDGLVKFIDREDPLYRWVTGLEWWFLAKLDDVPTVPFAQALAAIATDAQVFWDRDVMLPGEWDLEWAQTVVVERTSDGKGHVFFDEGDPPTLYTGHDVFVWKDKAWYYDASGRRLSPT